MFMLVLFYQNNSIFAQSENNLKAKPVLSVEISEADHIRRVKARNPKLADFRGLIMKEYRCFNLYPFLNYIFFDEGKSEIPERYILLKTDSTKWFNDSLILGGTLDKYYHILNIYAFRLIHNPNSKIKIIGCNDNESKTEKGNTKLSKARAMNVFNYLKNVWKIDEKRMEISWRNLPKHPSNSENDSLSMQENRRVEIICDDWDIMRPVYDFGSVTEPQPPNMNFVMKNEIDSELILGRRIEITHGAKIWNTLTEIGINDSKYLWNWKNTEKKYPFAEIPFTAQLVITTKSGEELKSDPVTIPILQIKNGCMRIEKSIDSSREIFNLILFPFDRFELGPIHERILNDYIYQRVYLSSVVVSYGHTANEGNTEHSMKLSEKRAKTVGDLIEKKLGRKYYSLTNSGVGEEDPLCTNELPEGRFYNRTVQLIIKTPPTEFEEYYR